MKKFNPLTNRKIYVMSNLDASKIMAGRIKGNIRLGLEEDDDDRFEEHEDHIPFIGRIRLRTL